MLTDEELRIVLTKDMEASAPERYRIPALLIPRVSSLMEKGAVQYDPDGNRIVRNRQAVQAIAPWMLTAATSEPARSSDAANEDPYSKNLRVAKILDAAGLADALNRIGDEADEGL